MTTKLSLANLSKLPKGRMRGGASFCRDGAAPHLPAGILFP